MPAQGGRHHPAKNLSSRLTWPAVPIVPTCRVLFRGVRANAWNTSGVSELTLNDPVEPGVMPTKLIVSLGDISKLRKCHGKEADHEPSTQK